MRLEKIGENCQNSQNLAKPDVTRCQTAFGLWNLERQTGCQRKL